MEIKNTGFLNPYEGLKQQYANNAIVNKYSDDWNVWANQGKLEEYLSTIDTFEKQGGKLSDLYKPDFLSSQERLVSMANEALGDREKIVKKTRQIVNEATQQVEEQEYETTEYEYTKSLLQNIADERELAYAKKVRSENVTAEDVFRTIGGFFSSTAEGIISSVNDVYNFFEGIVKGLDKWAKSGDSKQFDAGFREAFTNDAWLDAVTDELRGLVIDPETGNYVTKAARYIYSGGESFGRMVPSILMQVIGTGTANKLVSSGSKAAAIAAKGASVLAKSGQVFYYGAMASSNLKESLNSSDLCTRPTAELMANAAIKTAFEWGVEKMLGKAFGSTAIDSMAFGYIKTAGKISGKTAVLRVLKDAFQEGTEEYLQDFSSYMVDRVFGLWAEDYKNASEWNMQVATDAFVMGALMSLAGSSFRVFATKRIDTGITKYNKKGEVKYDKKGNVKTKKLGKLASYEYITNFDVLTSNMEKFINNENLSSEERTNLLAGMYTTLRTLTDVFGEMGEERYRKAAQMLDAIGQIDSKAEKYRVYQDLEAQDILSMRKDKQGKAKYNQYEYARDGKTTYDQMRAEYLQGGARPTTDTGTKPGTVFDYANVDKNVKGTVNFAQQNLRQSMPAMDENLLRARVSDYVAANLLMSNLELKQKAAEFIDTVKSFKNNKLTKASIKNLESKKDDLAENRITTPLAIINKDDAKVSTDKLTEKDLKIIKDVLGSSRYKSIIVAEDGTSPLSIDDDTLVVPVNNLSQGANGIFKTLAETKTVEICNTYQPLKLVVNTITDIYKKRFNDAEATSEVAVRRFLYDANFASTILFGAGDKDMVQFISVLNNIINNATEDTAMDAIQKKELKDRQADLKRVFKNYVINQQYVDYSSLSIFSAEEKAEIKNKRYTLDFYNRVTKTEYKTIDNPDDANVFVNRVKSLPRLTKDRKDALIQDFYSSNRVQRENAIKTVDKFYNYIWTSKYNGIIYMPMNNLKNTTFNSWLNSLGITIKELTKVDGLDEDVYLSIESLYGKVNTNTLLKYYKQSFEMFTKKDSNSRPAYTFTYDESAKAGERVVIKEVVAQKTKSELSSIEQSVREEQHHVTEDKFVYKPSGDAPKLDIFDKTKYDKSLIDMMTFDTAVRDVSVLSKDIQQDIKKTFGSLTSTNAYMYLNNKLMTETNNKFGLVLSEDGSVVVVDLVPFENAVTEDFDKFVRDAVKGENKSIKLNKLFKSEYLNNLTKNTTVYISSKFYSSDDHTTQGFYDARGNYISIFLPAAQKSSPKNVLEKYYIQAVRNTLIHEYLHSTQAGNLLVNGYSPEIYLNYKEEVKDEILADVKKHMPDVAERIKKYSLSKEDAYKLAAKAIYFGLGGEASSFGYAFKVTSFVPWNSYVTSKGDTVVVTPWGSEYSKDGVNKIVNDTKKSLANVSKSKAIDMPDAQKPQTIRETVTKAESKDNNLQYLYNAKKKEGAQVVLVDSRIKTLLRTLTPYMNKIDPHFAEQIKQGKIRTKSDIINYIVNELPRDIDAKTNATIAVINRTWYKNTNLKDGYAAEKIIYNLPKYYAFIKLLTKPDYREQLDQLLQDFGGTDELLYGKHTIDEIDRWIQDLSNAPSIKSFMDKEMIKYSEYDIDRGLAMNSLFNRYDGSLQSLMYTAATMKTYANPQLDWIHKPGKTSQKTTSLEQDVEGKRQGTDKTTTIADTVADKTSDILTELGTEFLTSSLNVSRDEKVSQIWTEMKTRYIESLTKDSDYSQALRMLSEEGPLYKKLESMTDEQIDKLYISYGFQDDLQVKQDIADRLANIASKQVKSRARHQIASNIYRYSKQIRSRLTGKQFQTFLENANKLAEEQGIELGFNKDGSYKIPRTVDADGKSIAMPFDQVLKLESLMKDLYMNVGQYTVTGSEEFKLALEKAKKRIERDYKKQLKAAKKGSEKVKYIEVGDMTIKTANNTTVPATFQKLLDAPSAKYSTSLVQYLSDGNTEYGVTNMHVFQKNAGDILAAMTTEDAKQLIDFLKNSVAVGEDAAKFTTTAMQTLTYIYSAYKEGTQFTDLTIDDIKWIESYMESTVHAGGKVLVTWRQLCDQYNPAKYALSLVSKMTALNIDEEYIINLAEVGREFNRPITGREVDENGNPLTAKQVREIRFRKLNQAFNEAYENAVANYKGSKRGLFEQMWKFQRMAMLSSPGTWVRNVVSNAMLEITNKVTPYIGEGIWKGLNAIESKVSKKQVGPKPERLLTAEQKADVHYAENTFDYKPNNRSLTELTKNYEEVIEKIDNTLSAQQRYQEQNSNRYNPELVNRLTTVKESVAADYAYRRALSEYRGSAQAQGVSIRRTLFDQYQITGTKVTEDVKNFINDQLFTGYEVTVDKNGKPVTMTLYDMIGDALNKYSDGRLGLGEVKSVDKQLVQLITKNIQAKLFNDNSFRLKPMNELSKLLYKCLSDDPWVKRTFTSYLGKVLTEDDTNLTKGLTVDVMQHISDAYTMAAWDYMHKANFFSKMENALRERVGEGGFFIYKQFAPFAVAGWNWFVEGLNYTPIGLAKAIIDYATLDKKIEKMDKRHSAGEGPTSRWASYIVKRNMGKGVIGTIGFAIGAMLAGFGVAGIDEDDDQIKLRVGDVYIDISNIFGTQGILLGMVMANAFADDETNGWDKFTSVLATTLNQVFMDSTFMDLYSIFEYSDSFGEGVLNSANNILMTFYPNMFKYFNRMTYQHKVKYSKGFLGIMQRDLVQMLPGIAYAFPKRTDPFTGEVQYKYLSGFWGYAIELSNGLLPIRFKPKKVSELEKEAIAQGLTKAELKGSYKDIGKFDADQVAQLNEFYGNLNNTALNDLYSGKTKYRVLDKKTNKYVELTYKQMTSEQKKSVINRIMTDNAHSAKIYVYTKSGGKYYTTNEEELARLKKLGISNVYKSTKNETYFN